MSDLRTREFKQEPDYTSSNSSEPEEAQFIYHEPVKPESPSQRSVLLEPLSQEPIPDFFVLESFQAQESVSRAIPYLPSLAQNHSPPQDHHAAVPSQDLGLPQAPLQPRVRAPTAEEKAQRHMKRQARNRKSAQDFRTRKKKEKEKLDEELREKNVTIAGLRKRIEELEGEVRLLRSAGGVEKPGWGPDRGW